MGLVLVCSEYHLVSQEEKLFVWRQQASGQLQLRRGSLSDLRKKQQQQQPALVSFPQH
jgi:hypothetical protein